MRYPNFNPGDKVVICGYGDIMFDRSMGQHVGDVVEVVQKNKSGLYQVRTWDGLKSFPKRALSLHVEPKPKEPLYPPSPEALERFEGYPDDALTRAMMREFDHTMELYSKIAEYKGWTAENAYEQFGHLGKSNG